MGTTLQKVGLAVVLIGVAMYIGYQVHLAGSFGQFLDNVKEGQFWHKTTTTGVQPTPKSTPVAVVATPKPTVASTPRPTAVLSTTQGTVLAAINTQRAKAGQDALVVNAQLQAAAQAHAQDMATRGYFSHESPEGTTFQERVSAAGYTSTTIAENIGVSTSNVLEVVNTVWMQSAGHKANMLSSSYLAGGIGVATGTYGGQSAFYVVAVFGAAK